MASGIEDWWVGNYPGLSIKNYKSMKVYSHFIKHSVPYTRQLKLFREAF